MHSQILYRALFIVIAAIAVYAAPWYERAFKSSRSLHIERSANYYEDFKPMLHRRLYTNGLGTATGTAAATGTGTAIATGTGNAKLIGTGCPAPISGAAKYSKHPKHHGHHPKHHGHHHVIPNGCPGPYPLSGVNPTGTSFATGTGVKAAFGTAASTGFALAQGTGTFSLLNALGTATPTAGSGYSRRSFNIPYNI